MEAPYGAITVFDNISAMNGFCVFGGRLAQMVRARH